MSQISLYSKSDCKLCDEARTLLHRVNEEFRFEISEYKLEEKDPLFRKYKDRFPVLSAENGREISGKLHEEEIRSLLLSLTPPPRVYYVAKFIEALALVAVFFGFIYGLMGDMWLDLYFFLGGIAVFLTGWGLEKWEVRRRKPIGNLRPEENTKS